MFNQKKIIAMGWISFHLDKPVKEWFINIFDKQNYNVIDVEIVSETELYAAIKNKKSGLVYAAVYMLEYSESFYNFRYKSMTEFVGRYINNCPERILKLLSPLEKSNENKYAIDWRNRCLKNIELKNK